MGSVGFMEVDKKDDTEDQLSRLLNSMKPTEPISMITNTQGGLTATQTEPAPIKPDHSPAPKPKTQAKSRVPRAKTSRGLQASTLAVARPSKHHRSTSTPNINVDQIPEPDTGGRRRG